MRANACHVLSAEEAGVGVGVGAGMGVGEDEDKAEGEGKAWVETATMHDMCNCTHCTIVKRVRW